MIYFKNVEIRRFPINKINGLYAHFSPFCINTTIDFRSKLNTLAVNSTSIYTYCAGKIILLLLITYHLVLYLVLGKLIARLNVALVPALWLLVDPAVELLVWRTLEMFAGVLFTPEHFRLKGLPEPLGSTLILLLVHTCLIWILLLYLLLFYKLGGVFSPTLITTFQFYMFTIWY